jgi:hypothetical protein
MRPQIAEFGAITPRAYADQAQSQRGGCTHGHHRSTTHSEHKQNLHTNRSTELGPQRDFFYRECKRENEPARRSRRHGEDGKPPLCHPKPHAPPQPSRRRTPLSESTCRRNQRKREERGPVKINPVKCVRYRDSKMRKFREFQI